MYVTGTDNFSSDYNNIYSINDFVWISGDYINLSELQSNTEYEQNSVSINPVFQSTDNLTPQSSMLDNLGSTGTGVQYDINGVLRSAETPDMGAIEFTGSYPPIGGEYTIGSGGDYESINDAVEALLNSGISDPVIFNLLPGEYEEQVEIPPISGASTTNTITFQSQSGNPDDVSWKYNATNSSTNYIIKLIGADHIKIKNITFDPYDNDGTLYGKIIVL